MDEEKDDLPTVDECAISYFLQEILNRDAPPDAVSVVLDNDIVLVRIEGTPKVYGLDSTRFTKLLLKLLRVPCS